MLCYQLQNESVLEHHIEISKLSLRQDKQPSALKLILPLEDNRFYILCRLEKCLESFYLDRDIDTILQNDSGSFATRKLLSRQLSREDDRLSGKKLVIWQFATRELSSGNWQDFPLEYKEKEASEFFVVQGNKEITVRGEIIGLSRSPRPGSVPYKDNIVTLHLGNVVDVETGAEYGEALVYLWGMKDNALTAVATKRNRDMVTLKLIDWDSVEGEFSSYRRSTLDDEMIEYPGKVIWVSAEAEFTPKTIQTKEERLNMVYAVKIRVENDGRIKIGMPGELWLNNAE